MRTDIAPFACTDMNTELVDTAPATVPTRYPYRPATGFTPASSPAASPSGTLSRPNTNPAPRSLPLVDREKIDLSSLITARTRVHRSIPAARPWMSPPRPAVGSGVGSARVDPRFGCEPLAARQSSRAAIGLVPTNMSIASWPPQPGSCREGDARVPVGRCVRRAPMFGFMAQHVCKILLVWTRDRAATGASFANHCVSRTSSGDGAQPMKRPSSSYAKAPAVWAPPRWPRC